MGRKAGRRTWALVASLAPMLSAPVAAQGIDGRWAFAPYACDGELFTRNETPLLVHRFSIRWFSYDCTVVSSYKVREAHYLEAKCASEGRTSVIPILLERRGNRLRVGWNREPVAEMQLCR